MRSELVEIIEADAPLGDPLQGEQLRRLLEAVMSAAQIDQQSDTLEERMAARVAQIESRVRGAWRARWCSRHAAARETAAEELARLLHAREQERRRYLFGVECVLTLRSKHIDTIEWAMRHAPRTPLADRLLEADLCRSFSIMLDDGTEVVPFRVRDSARRVRAFKVSDGGNKNVDALLVYDEDELKRYVVGLGFRVRCKSRDGTRSGLYSAAKPNRMIETSSPRETEDGERR